MGRDVEVKRTPVWSKRTAQDAIVVCATWGLLLVCMALAQRMNYQLGFAVWPLGEDRNWIDILQNNKGTAAARAFWEVSDRNPLAPWWYIALRPIILRYDAGLLIIRDKSPAACSRGLLFSFRHDACSNVRTRRRLRRSCFSRQRILRPDLLDNAFGVGFFSYVCDALQSIS